MFRIFRKIPYFKRCAAARRSRGQSLVEFAFISMILFMLLFGILEVGRMMFIFSQITSAAEEGARWGMVHPLQAISNADDGLGTYPVITHTDYPCNIVDQAKMRTTLIPTDTQHLRVYVSYDGGADGIAQTHPIGHNDTSADFRPGTDRIVVQVVYNFHFLVGIFDNFIPNGLDMQMVAARTILQDESTQPPPPVTCPDGAPQPGGG